MPHHHDDPLLQIVAQGFDQLTEAVNGVAAAIKKAAKEKQKVRFDYGVQITTKKGKTMPLELTFTTEQQVTVHLNPVTPKGKPVALDGVPTWQVAVGDVTLQPATDGLSCTIVSADTPGQSQVLVSADADLGSGVDTISDTIDCLVGDPMASSLGLAADPPVTKP